MPPYKSAKDIFCLRADRMVNSYRKVSINNLELRALKAPLHYVKWNLHEDLFLHIKSYFQILILLWKHFGHEEKYRQPYRYKREKHRKLRKTLNLHQNTHKIYLIMQGALSGRLLSYLKILKHTCLLSGKTS